MKQAERRGRTRREIQEAFMVLVSERGFDRVTVKDICLRADINRNTFYLHYTDKDTLASAIVDRLIATQAGGVIEEATHMSRSAPEKTEQIVKNVLSMLEEERQFYQVFFTDEGLSRHLRPLRQLAYRMMVAGASAPISPVAVDFVIGGMEGVLTSYLDGKIGTADEVAPKLARLLISSFTELAP